MIPRKHNEEASVEQSKCVCVSTLKRTLAMDGDGEDGLMAQSVSAPPTLATLRSILSHHLCRSLSIEREEGSCI